MIKKAKKLTGCLLIAFMLLFQSMSAFAADEGRQGTISISLTDAATNVSKEHVVFEYEKVADIVDGEYVLLDKYQALGIDLNQMQSAEDMEKATEAFQAAVKSSLGTAKTDKEGKTVISNLETGVYFLWVSDRAEFDNVHPALVSVPTWNEEQNTMDMEVSVYPKHSTVVVPVSPTTADGVGGNALYYMLAMCFAGCIGILIYKRRKENSKC